MLGLYNTLVFALNTVMELTRDITADLHGDVLLLLPNEIFHLVALHLGTKCVINCLSVCKRLYWAFYSIIIVRRRIFKRTIQYRKGRSPHVNPHRRRARRKKKMLLAIPDVDISP